MAFTFVHTGDWHIAKPFGRFGAEQAGMLRAARLAAIERLAALARAQGAGHVLVAGDVFDQPSLPDRQMREPLVRMRGNADLAWHIIPGNHDPATSGGIWHRVLADGLPGNVHLHLEASPVELPGAMLLPAPLASKSMTHDPTAWMDIAPTPPGVLRIGLAHGSVQGFGSERTSSISISPKRAASAGLSYLALGDWHGVRQIGQRTWYAGTPEPDSYLDNGQGAALVVRLEDERASPAVGRFDTAEHVWIERELDAADGADLSALEAEVGRLGPIAGRCLLQVRAIGRISLAADRELSARLDRLDAAVFHLSRRLEGLGLAPVASDLERLGDSAVRRISDELAAQAAAGNDPEHTTAARALRHLFALVGPDHGGRA